MKCHLVATLEKVLLRLGCCLAPVSWRSMTQNSDPTLDFTRLFEAPASFGEVFFAFMRFLDTNLIGLGFATAEPSSAVLSRALLDKKLCFLFERKWQQEKIEKFLTFNNRRRCPIHHV